MKEKPILFSTEMIKAILDGRKTMTRRVCKVQPTPTDKGFDLTATLTAGCPYGKIGDRLWVREAFGFKYSRDCVGGNRKDVVYKADAEKQIAGIEASGKEWLVKWKPSIFMPRWASRINLKITNIRVERLQNITAQDVEREGLNIIGKLPSPLSLPKNITKVKLQLLCDEIAQREFWKLWDSINGKKYPWSSNSYVWVIEFNRV